MSIRPPFALAILDGSKKIEFRKRPLAEDIDKVVIYTTAPVKAVVGEFYFSEQIVASPSELWQRYSKVAGIDEKSFFEYFNETTYAIGILIDKVIKYEEPQLLENFNPGTRAPQSVKYLELAP